MLYNHEQAVTVAIDYQKLLLFVCSAAIETVPVRSMTDRTETAYVQIKVLDKPLHRSIQQRDSLNPLGMTYTQITSKILSIHDLSALFCSRSRFGKVWMGLDDFRLFFVNMVPGEAKMGEELIVRRILGHVNRW